MALLKWLTILMALCIAWKDFRERAVEWIFFPLLLILVLTDAYMDRELRFENILINLAILVVQLGVLAIWVYVSKKKWIMEKEQFIGWGDIVFFAVLAFCFSPLNYRPFT